MKRSPEWLTGSSKIQNENEKVAGHQHRLGTSLLLQHEAEKD